MLENIPSVDEVIKFCPDKSICDEIIPSYTFSIYGKINTLEDIHLVRTLHNEKHTKKALPENMQLTHKSEDFKKSFEYLKKKISK